MLVFCLFAFLASVWSTPQYSRDSYFRNRGAPGKDSKFGSPSDRNYEPAGSYLDDLVIIPYKIHHAFSEEARDMIYVSLLDYEYNSCLTFYEVVDNNDVYNDNLSIFFNYTENDIGQCYNYRLPTDKEGPLKVITMLNEKVCFYDNRRIKQLIFGALGFIHEDLRSDRDDYVTILWENIATPYEKKYSKVRENVTNWILPYDYFSISHHYSDYFSKDYKPTITMKDSTQPLFRDTRLSFLDLYKIDNVFCHSRKNSVAYRNEDVIDQFLISPLYIPIDDTDGYDNSKRDLGTTTGKDKVITCRK